MSNSPVLWNVIIYLGPAIMFIYALVAMIHCAVSPANSYGKRILMVFLLLISIGIGPLVYGMNRSQPQWLRRFARITLLLFILSGVLTIFRMRQLQSDMLENFGKPLMPDSVRLPIPTTLPSEISDPTAKVRAYRYLVQINQNSMLLASFAKDHNLFKQDPSWRAALCDVSPFAADAYEKNGDKEKAAYYFALSAKLLAEKNPKARNVWIYISRAYGLDPTSPYVQQIKKSLKY